MYLGGKSFDVYWTMMKANFYAHWRPGMFYEDRDFAILYFPLELVYKKL